MLRIGILFSFILIASAKIYGQLERLDDGFVAQDDREKISSDDPLWVLKLDSGWEMKLKLASPGEEEEFEETNRPLIDNYDERTNANFIRGSPRPQVEVDESMVVGKEDIFRLVNKFALYTNEEPDSYITESNGDGTSITIYFKNAYTSLVVNVDSEQWHFFIGARSPLPSWFYENHTLKQSSDSVTIPEEVQQRFYVALLRLLHTILSYPLFKK